MAAPDLRIHEARSDALWGLALALAEVAERVERRRADEVASRLSRAATVVAEVTLVPDGSDETMVSAAAIDAD